MAIIDEVLIGLILPFHVRCSTKMYISWCPHWISYYNDNYKCPDSTIAQNLIFFFCFQPIYGILKFALRVCTKQWNLPYIDLMEKYNLTELRTRRNYLSLSLLHKIIYEDCICIFPMLPLYIYPVLQCISHALSQLAHLCYLNHTLICFRTPSSPTQSHPGILFQLI